MSNKNSIIIFGAGGHAKVVADAIRLQGTHVIAGVIDPGKAGTEFLSLTVQKDNSEFAATNFIVAVGDNRARKQIFLQLCKDGWTPAVVQHPAAIVAADVKIAGGTVLFARAVINAGSAIGANCIVNTAAVVEHDCVVSAHAHISSGACLAGSVKIGEGCLIGIGSNIIPNITIGSWSTLGGGSTAINDVPENATAVGVPARVKKVSAQNASVKV